MYNFTILSGYTNHTLHFPPLANRFADTNARTSETHSILDFQAGKDVGLGMFGVTDGSSVRQCRCSLCTIQQQIEHFAQIRSRLA